MFRLKLEILWKSSNANLMDKNKIKAKNKILMLLTKLVLSQKYFFQ